jgi:phosphoglycolate phosphatase
MHPTIGYYVDVPNPIVIFDLDGTLVDSTNQISNAMNLARRDLGLIELPENFIANQLGKPIRELIPEGDLNNDLIEKLIFTFRQSLQESIIEHNEVYVGAIELIICLKLSGCSIGIATSKPQHLADLVVEHSSLKGLIDVIQGTDNFPPKPNSEVLNRVITRNQYDKAVMIGDRTEDLEAAKGAGIPSVGVAQSAHSKQVLLLSGANLVYENIAGALGDYSSILSLIKTSS